ncbi:Do family serine endopeptidase [Novipirellula artificiosorum]|uniref:PDZ domain-containing protein n=1 Tax=Novipirellula artificiosorum TaxID=2528016 RepID=A0A5C6CMK5_9BACT|nr:hypothetical protein [Novipirellula artificiosorum]TWU24807.1 hypothetical protein Poly41_70850 [Novipirellula artificiosorum]
MYRLATLAVAAITTVTLCCAQPPLFDSSGQVDVDSIRRQVMSGMPVGPANGNAPIFGMPPKTTPCQTWGIQVMKVPALFTQCHDLLANGNGLLVVKVAKGSAADRAGIEAGMVMLSIDSQDLSRIQDVRPVHDGATVELLTEKGLRTAVVELATMSRAYSSASSPSLPNTALSNTGESVSVSNVNGQIRIQATLMTSRGAETIDIQGNRNDVDRQIDALPAEIADQLRRKVSY